MRRYAVDVPYRRMRDPLFRRSQEEGLRLPHIATINALVDELREEGRGWVPYVAPLYGGIEAEMLSVLRDPGPKTNLENDGSGFLCLENDDPAAELLATMLAEAGIDPVKMTPLECLPVVHKPSAQSSRVGSGNESAPASPCASSSSSCCHAPWRRSAESVA